mgnify:CR=1 FL=1
MLGSTRQYVQTYAYVCIASHRRICEATSPYGLTIVTTTFLFALGDNSGEDTPVPIPNTAVKLPSADDTWRETAWESRSLPVF